jgi:opacity protein-like surface antigen
MPRDRRTAGCSYLALATLALLAAGSASAGGRPEDTSRNWFGEVSGGWAFPQSDASDLLDDDFIVSGGATYWPAARKFGINLQAGYTSFDLTDEAIADVNRLIALDPNNSGSVDGGDVESWHFTANVIWSPNDRDNGLYLTGGIGAYRLKGTVTETSLVYFPPFCDPWYWWWCVPGGFGTGNVVRGSDSTTEFGYNLGLGYGWRMREGVFFIEARYHFVSTDTEDLEYVPLLFGFRW